MVSEVRAHYSIFDAVSNYYSVGKFFDLLHFLFMEMEEGDAYRCIILEIKNVLGSVP